MVVQFRGSGKVKIRTLGSCLKNEPFTGTLLKFKEINYIGVDLYMFTTTFPSFSNVEPTVGKFSVPQNFAGFKSPHYKHELKQYRVKYTLNYIPIS